MMKVRELKGDARDLVDADRQRSKRVTISVNRGSTRICYGTRIDADLWDRLRDADWRGFKRDADWAATARSAGTTARTADRPVEPDE